MASIAPRVDVQRTKGTVKSMNKWTLALIFTIALGVLATAPTEAREAGGDSSSHVVTKEEQQAMTPQQVLQDLKDGNRRFVEGRLTHYDYLAQAAKTSAEGQYPKAIVLGCLDSRVPPEIIFDQGIGDIFVGRVAGNFENVDMLGSFEFGAKVAGSKVILVLGHTQCGAVKGAADGVELGNLTDMLDNFDEALAEAKTLVEGKFDSSNDAFVQAAVEANVRKTVDDILAGSPLLMEMVEAGDLLVVGGVYDLASGKVDWLDS
jgi:carbonic anhydrase